VVESDLIMRCALSVLEDTETAHQCLCRGEDVADGQLAVVYLDWLSWLKGSPALTSRTEMRVAAVGDYRDATNDWPRIAGTAAIDAAEHVLRCALGRGFEQ
jgi:hypothetical protein